MSLPARKGGENKSAYILTAVKRRHKKKKKQNKTKQKKKKMAVNFLLPGIVSRYWIMQVIIQHDVLVAIFVVFRCKASWNIEESEENTILNINVGYWQLCIKVGINGEVCS